ncbi:MAG: PEP/pyruvate-binding domain-containing protein [Arachnia propionica]|uniref:PEP/pyruvate-binding domain-containing protein n=1 Tax=Arachnia propionica TaxID=1750 RepID=UPI00270DDFE4|nr:PEP/pyruvate-binding domain-containing protein [Arachnia propionica]
MIIDLHCVDKDDLALVGGKGANLGELLAAGLPVPDGFCITTNAHRAAVDGSVPDTLAGEILAATARLGGPVAVRSSATAEDLPEASFAGQQETVLGVVGDDVIAAVERCWTSLWGERAVAYRAEQGIDDTDVSIAVVVQRMIPADAAGVAFTVDPVTGRRAVVIESAFGLGESVVSGAVTPDSHTVGRRLRRRPGHKPTRIDLRPDGGTSTSPVADPTAPAITDRQARRIAALAKRVERRYGRPMDIEWAIEGEQVWLLQARPVTTTAHGRPGLLSRMLHDDIVEHFPCPYPLDLAMVEMLLPILRTAGSRIGLDLQITDDLLTMDDDGVARIGYPRVRIRAPWRALHPARRLEPHSWEKTQGQQARDLAARFAALRLDSLTDHELADAMVELLARARELVEHRMQYLAQHLMRGLRLDALLRLTRSGLTQFDLLGDLDYVTATLNQELHHLATAAPPEVRRLLAATPIDVEALRSTAWWGRVEDFLTRFGARATRMYQVFSSRSWHEDLPGFLTLLAMTADATPPRQVPLPRFLTRRFPRLLADYRAGHVMREASVLQFEELAVVMRRLATEAARRLDVTASRGLFLTFVETLRALHGEDLDITSIIARREAARSRAEAVWTATPHGAATSANSSGDGVAASPGRASGPARLIHGPHEFHRLQPGDVLVCHSTDPAWTPLFARAVAVVAATGGRLSHAAIVAREYGIPAVLGVPGAMEIIDGSRLVVDGSAGTVAPGAC